MAVGGSEAAASAGRERPLAGTRVLDLGRVIAGPFAGRMLSDLGADVVKVEPPEGDISRGWGRRVAGIGGSYTAHNLGKRSICIDLAAPGAAELVLRLVAEADIVIENFRPGIMERFGLGWEALHAANPAVVLLSISGFGQDGPERDRASYAPIVHAEIGLLDRQAHLDGDQPTDLALSAADVFTALHGVVGLLAAYHHAARTGEGQHVDVAMVAAMVSSDDGTQGLLDGQPAIRPGNAIYEATGGPIIIAGDEKWLWHQLSRRCGLVDPSGPGATIEDKVVARRQAIDAFLVSFDDRPSLITQLDAANLAWGDVHPHRDAHARQRTIAQTGIITDVDDRAGGRRRVVQSPYRFSGLDAGVSGPAAFLGEHNRDAVADWLDVSDAELDELHERGILLAPPPG